MEDPLNRIQSRFRKMVPTGEIYQRNKNNLIVTTKKLPVFDEGGGDIIRDLALNHRVEVIGIDTLGKHQIGEKEKSSNAYKSDVAIMARLEDLVRTLNISILCVHHNNKSKSNNPVDQISGSAGIAGAFGFLGFAGWKGRLLIPAGRLLISGFRGVRSGGAAGGFGAGGTEGWAGSCLGCAGTG